MEVKRKAAIAAAGLGATAMGIGAAAPPVGAAAGEVVNVPVSCTASKNISGFFGWDFFTTGTVSAKFNATLRFTVRSDNARADLTRITYSFTNAEYDYWLDTPGGGPLTQHLSVHNKSNVNIDAPVSWDSADNLSASGTLTPGVNGPRFSVANGGRVTIQGIPDIADMPDPSCTTSATLSWK
jgi:hypothetical protein